MENNKISRPEWKWYYAITPAFINKGKKDYLKDRDIWEKQNLSQHELIAGHMEKNINGVSALLILIITTLWTLLPPLVNMPNWLHWTKMGMNEFGWDNWGNQIMLTIIPSASGTLIHKLPYVIPQKKARLIFNSVIKAIPVLILIICAYLPIQLKKYFKFKKLEKEQLIYNLTKQEKEKE